MWRSFIALLLLTTCALRAGAQSPAPANVYVFPLFTDGTANGTTYQSVLKIAETGAAIPFRCTLTQWNTSATFIGVNGDIYSPSTISVGFNGPASVTQILNYPLEILRTNDPSPAPLKTGYAKLSCPGTVQTQLQFSLFDAKNNKLGEAAIAPAVQGNSFQFLIDTRDGTRLGFSLTNDSAVAGGYFKLIARDQFNSPTSFLSYDWLDPQSQVSRFVDEMLPLPPNFVGSIELVGVPGGQNYAVGLQFTGTVFSTIQPDVRATPLPN
jgi:hypothetical protein